MDGRISSHRSHASHHAWLYLILSCLSLSAHAQVARCRVDIPAESLSKELIAFGRQCKILPLLLSVGDELDGIGGNAVVGNLEPVEALRRILSNTGWTFSFRNPDEVSIEPDRQPNIPPNRSDTFVSQAPYSDDTVSVGTGDSMPKSSLSPAPTDQVLVTGTHIRGVDTITSPLISLAAGQIADTGYAGAQSMIDNTLPMSSNNTPRDDYTGAVLGNYGTGQGINLRGLGVGATLVLVDGRRQPLAGFYGNFVDVSAVPSSAIDRIEVIADGASALYGSDAIAGVVNIILRHDFVGAETSARYARGEGGGDEALASQVFGSQWDGGHGMVLYQYTDLTSVPIAARSYAANSDKRPQGGDDFSSIDANPGNILNPATYMAAYAIPPGQDGRALSVTQLLPSRVNWQNPLLGMQLYPQRTTHSVYLTAEEEASTAVTWFFEGRLDQREDALQNYAYAQTLIVPASNPFFVDPFGHSPYVAVGYSFLDDLGNIHQTSKTVTATASIGLKAALGNGWQSALSLSDGIQNMNATGSNWVNNFVLRAALADSDPATAFNPFGAGSNTPRSTLNQISAVQVDHASFRIPDLSAVADGPLFASGNTSAKLAMGLDLRQEYLRDSNVSDGYENLGGAYQREIGSAFAELAVSLPEHIEVSLAGRYEHYSDFGSTTNPKAGIRWSPWGSVKLRASWGTSFRAPQLPDVDASHNTAGFVSLSDPKSPTGQSLALVEQGNSPDLHQEKAATWTAGLDLAPATVPGLRASLTYYSIDYRDQIAQPDLANPGDILEDEAVWGDVIQRNPSLGTVMAICRAVGSRFYAVNDVPMACPSTPPAVIVDLRVRNLSRTVDKGLDLTLEQRFDNALGFFQWDAQGAYILTFAQAASDSAPLVSVANTVSNPIKLKARATLSWSERPDTLPGFSCSLAENFTGAYLDNISVPNRRIRSYSTVDAQLGYSTGEGHRWFENTKITLSTTNLLDTNPPFVNTELGFDQPITPAAARLVTLSFRKKW